MGVSQGNIMLNIEKLNFGQDSAESEIETLYQVFLPTAFYNNLKTRDLKKWLVLGRKGAGKTAACIMLFRHLQNEHMVSLLTPTSLSAAKSVILEKTSINSDEASILKWKYVFLLEASRYIVQSAESAFGENHLKWDLSLRKVREFLIAQDTDTANQLDRTLKFVRSINKIAISILKVEGSLEVNGKTEQDDKLGDELDKVFSIVETASSHVFQKPIYILIDQVDDLWDSTEAGQNLIIGLLRAAKKVNDSLSRIKIIVFLRSDIFSHLRFHDYDKYRSHTELIGWDKENLKKLIALRIHQSTGSKGDTESLWNSVFPLQIKAKPSFNYIANLTLLRPRDLIQLCNICRDQAFYKGNDKITMQNIEEATPIYSRWKLEDLVAEYTIQYPFLEKILKSIFYYKESARFSKTDFKRLFTPIKAQFIEQYGSVYFEPLDSLLQIFYDIGFIGAIQNGKILSSTRGDNFNMSYVSEFEIHLAFQKGLYIEEPDEDVTTNIIVGDVVNSNISVSGNVSGDIFVGKNFDRIKILLINASTTQRNSIGLNEESRKISESLRRSEFRERFEFITNQIVSLSNLSSLILHNTPRIVHFSENNSGIGQIAFEDNNGKVQPVSAELLSKLFNYFKGEIRCVVLNGCYTKIQAEAIAASIPFVIGISPAIKNDTSFSFTQSFYQALAYGRDLESAFKFGVAQIQLQNETDENNLPILIKQGNANGVLF